MLCGRTCLLPGITEGQARNGNCLRPNFFAGDIGPPWDGTVDILPDVGWGLPPAPPSNRPTVGWYPEGGDYDQDGNDTGIARPGHGGDFRICFSEDGSFKFNKATTTMPTLQFKVVGLRDPCKTAGCFSNRRFYCWAPHSTAMDFLPYGYECRVFFSGIEYVLGPNKNSSYVFLQRYGRRLVQHRLNVSMGFLSAARSQFPTMSLTHSEH